MQNAVYITNIKIKHITNQTVHCSFAMYFNHHNHLSHIEIAQRHMERGEYCEHVVWFIISAHDGRRAVLSFSNFDENKVDL